MKKEYCDHDDVCMDKRICLLCGADLTEELVEAAEFEAELIRENGILRGAM